MSIIEIEVSYSREGHVLAEDIFNKYGAAVVIAHTTLNSFIIKKLRALGVRKIKIFDTESRLDKADFSVRFNNSYGEKAIFIKEIMNEIISTERLNIIKLDKLSKSIYSEIGEKDYIINCLSDIRCADQYTYYHSLNVAFYSALIGTWLKLSEEEILNVIKSGLLHDIGKNMVHAEIINKKGKLLAQEYEEIKRHTLYGFDMIKKAQYIGDDIKNTVLMHHEREDASGYPFGYAGHQINKSSKIVAIADVYDAMTSKRVYGKKATPFDAFEMFTTEGIKLFDTNITNTFLTRITPYYVGSEILINSREIAQVVYIPPHCITKPVIKLGKQYIDLYKETKYAVTACYPKT